MLYTQPPPSVTVKPQPIWESPVKWCNKTSHSHSHPAFRSLISKQLTTNAMLSRRWLCTVIFMLSPVRSSLSFSWCSHVLVRSFLPICLRLPAATNVDAMSVREESSKKVLKIRRRSGGPQPYTEKSDKVTLGNERKITNKWVKHFSSGAESRLKVGDWNFLTCIVKDFERKSEANFPNFHWT